MSTKTGAKARSCRFCAEYYDRDTACVLLHTLSVVCTGPIDYNLFCCPLFKQISRKAN